MRMVSWLHGLKRRLSRRKFVSRRSRYACPIAAMVAGVESLEARMLLSAVVWAGGTAAGGDLNWNNAANWSRVPAIGWPDDVIGDLGGATISVSGTAVGIHSLHTSGAIDISGTEPAYRPIRAITRSAVDNGSLSIAGGLTLNGTAYVGAADGSTRGDIYFDGTQTVGGTGGIVFGGHRGNTEFDTNLVESLGTVTLGPNLTVHGENGTLLTVNASNSFINQGTLAADGGGSIDVLGPGSLQNSGTLAANNGGLYVGPDSGSGGTGVVSATNGGGVTLINSAGHFTQITANGGSVSLDGSWTNSGPIVFSGGGSLSLYNGSNSGAITATGGTMNFGGTWSDSGSITLTACKLNLYGSGTFTSTMTSDAASAVEFYGAITTVNLKGGARVGLSGGTLYDGTLTLDPGQTLHIDGRGSALSNLDPHRQPRPDRLRPRLRGRHERPDAERYGLRGGGGRQHPG